MLYASYTLPFIPAIITGTDIAIGALIAAVSMIPGDTSQSQADEGNVIPFPGSQTGSNQGETGQCPADPDDPDDCELMKNSLIIQEIKIKEDARGAPSGANEIQYASNIRARKKAWNRAVDAYNQRCPKKIGRRFTDV